MFFIIAVFIAAIVIILLFAVKIKAQLSFRHNRIKAGVTWIGIPLFRKEFVFRRDKDKFLTLYGIQKDGEKLVISLDDVIRLSTPKKKEKKTNTKEALTYIHSKAAYDIKITFEIGTGDASLTALSCGFLQIVIGTLYAMRRNPRMKLKAAVIPEFSKQQLCFESDCIIKVSPVNIMIGYMIHKKILRR